MFYSACISALFMGQPLETTLSRVREAGLDRYEFWGWWDDNMDALLAAQRQQGLRPAALCTRMIPLTEPSQRIAYLEGLRETIHVCRKLDCPAIITQTGPDLPGVPREKQHESLVQGLRECVPLLEEAGLTLVVEPLNTKIDHKGYYLSSSDEAFQVIDEVGSPRVRVLFDLYHQYIMEGLSAERIVANLDKIAHFHMAGYPGRHEPLIKSEIDYPALLRAIRDAGYTGGIGFEYFSAQDTDAGLKELVSTLRAL